MLCAKKVNVSIMTLYKVPFLEHRGVADKDILDQQHHIVNHVQNGSTTSDSQRQRCLENVCPQCDQPSQFASRMVEDKTRQDLPSNTPIARPTPFTIPNGIRIQSAVLPQYIFWTETHRPTDTLNRRQLDSMSTYDRYTDRE